MAAAGMIHKDMVTARVAQTLIRLKREHYVPARDIIAAFTPMRSRCRCNGRLFCEGTSRVMMLAWP